MTLPDVSTDRLGDNADAVYERLLAAHEGLTAEESAALNARLVLVLMNAVGDRDAIEAAIALAERAGAKGNIPPP